MRQLFKLWQTWLSIALFLLALFLGVGLPMIIPSTPYNGVIIIIIGLAVSVPLFIWAYRLYRRQKSIPQPPKEAIKLNLPDTLTAMHRRLIELQKEKASHTNVSLEQLKKALPTLADRAGAVKLEDWPAYKHEIQLRILKASPPKPRMSLRGKFNFKRWARLNEEYKEQVYHSALLVTREAKDELFHTKEWTLADCIKVSEWLDGYGWGVKELRDNDQQWKPLYESISNRLRTDDVLNVLIKEHIDLSYIYNSGCLIIHYSSKFKKDDIYSLILYEALMGSPMSPEQADMDLTKVLGRIEERLKETKERIQSKIVVGGLIGRAKNVKIRDSHYKGKITTQGKPEDIDMGGLIGQGENVEVVDSSANAEIEYKQGKE
jgi:hypothetical protein